MSTIFEGLAGVFAQHLGEREVIRYTPRVGDAFDLPEGHVIYFEQPTEGLREEGAAGVDAVRRTLHLQVADVPNPAQDDRVTVRGVVYKIVTPIACDGNGMVIVTLAKV